MPAFGGTYIGLKNFVHGAIQVDDIEFSSGAEPTPGSGELLAQTLALWVEPELRDSMSGNSGSCNHRLTLDGPIHSLGLARVTDSIKSAVPGGWKSNVTGWSSSRARSWERSAERTSETWWSRSATDRRRSTRCPQTEPAHPFWVDAQATTDRNARR